MKGIQEINNILNEFLEEFECTADIGTDFEYIYVENKIHYALVVADKMEQGFMRSVERLNPLVKCDIFLWSFLHEIGHNETIEELTDEESDISNITKEWIAAGAVPPDAYYDCPDERMATEWAVRYANSHIEELMNFWSKLQKAIINFYKINDIH